MEQWSITISNLSGVVAQFESSEIQFVLGTGRAEGIYTIGGEGVAPRHAWLWISGRGLQVEDLAGGALVNGEYIQERVQVSYPVRVQLGEVSVSIEVKAPQKRSNPAAKPSSGLPGEHSVSSNVVSQSAKAPLGQPCAEPQAPAVSGNKRLQAAAGETSSASNLVRRLVVVAAVGLVLLWTYHGGLRKTVENTAGNGSETLPSTPDGESRLSSQQTRVQESKALTSESLIQREEVREAHLQELKTKLMGYGLRVDLDQDKGIVRLPEMLLFEPGSSHLRPEGQSALLILAREMLPLVSFGGADSQLKWEAVYIEGHTDNIPINTPEFPSNKELSKARASNTFKALAACEPELENAQNHEGKSLVAIRGYGDQRPIADNTLPEGRAANRRIDIRFVIAASKESQAQKSPQQALESK